MLYAWNCKPQMEGTDGPRPRLNNKETLDPRLLERIAVISPTSDFANVTFANVFGRFANAMSRFDNVLIFRFGEAT